MRYFKNTSWMLGEQMLRMIAGLFVGIWVARYLGPEQFGIFSYALAFTSIFSVIAKLGLDGIVVRDLINEPDKRDIYLGTAFWLKLAGALITLSIVALATLFTSNDHTTNLYIFIIASGIIFQSFEVVDFYFQSQVLSKFVSICKMTQLLFSSLLKLYLIYTTADLFWFVLVSLIDQLILALSLYIAYRYQRLGGFYAFFDRRIAEELLKSSLPLILSSIVIMVYMRIDQIMIKEILGEKEVGLYSAAVRLSEVWYFIPTIIANSIFPAIVNAKKISELVYHTKLQQLYTLQVWLAIGIIFPMTFLSEYIVILLFGETYKSASQALMIHLWTGVVVSYGCVFSRYLLVEKLNNIINIHNIQSLIINIMLNYILIKFDGIRGAATSTLCSVLLSYILLYIFNKNLREKIVVPFFNAITIRKWIRA